jgi:hypothetical protein
MNRVSRRSGVAGRRLPCAEGGSIVEDQILARRLAAAEAETPLAAVVYRSVADRRLSPARLGELLDAARARNAEENLTGLLLYDGERFVQWLEGPADGLHRVWTSIQADGRHADIELLGTPRLPVRLFRSWDMGLAGRSRTIAEGVDDVVLVDQRFLGQLDAGCHSLGALLDLLARVAPTESDLSTAQTHEERSEHLRVLCLDHVLPLVQLRHGVGVDPEAPLGHVGAQLPRIDPDFVDRFADHLRFGDPEAAARVWRRLRSLGCTPASLHMDLVEPTARRLGDLWADDACSGAELLLAQIDLLSMARRDAPASAARTRAEQPQVLVASPPGADNLLGPALAAARLEALQCHVEFLTPDGDEELGVRLADAAGDRPLRVMLYGRQVAEDPHLHARVDADAAFATLAEFGHATVEGLGDR